MRNTQLEHATINNIKHYHSIITEKNHSGILALACLLYVDRC